MHNDLRQNIISFLEGLCNKRRDLFSVAHWGIIRSNRIKFMHGKII